MSLINVTKKEKVEDIRKNMRDIRRDFTYGTLDEKEVPSNPFDLLKKWLDEAVQSEIKDANAFVLSTAVDHQPDSRVVLIRDITQDALHFYTNYESKKAEDLKENTKAAANIFWPDLDRQIRLRVQVKKLSSELSDDYFRTRPRTSQIGAWASDQSSELLGGRATLETRIKELEKRFEGKEVPRPEFWGGYALVPDYIEFWQGRPSRLHDRVIYECTTDQKVWSLKRLYP